MNLLYEQRRAITRSILNEEIAAAGRALKPKAALKEEEFDFTHFISTYKVNDKVDINKGQTVIVKCNKAIAMLDQAQKKYADDPINLHSIMECANYLKKMLQSVNSLIKTGLGFKVKTAKNKTKTESVNLYIDQLALNESFDMVDRLSRVYENCQFTLMNEASGKVSFGQRVKGGFSKAGTVAKQASAKIVEFLKAIAARISAIWRNLIGNNRIQVAGDYIDVHKADKGITNLINYMRVEFG